MRTAARAFFLVMCAVFGAMASTYTQNFSSVTSVTVTNANHGIGSDAIAVTVWDTSGCTGSALDKSLYTYTFNGSHDVAVTFNGGTSRSGCVFLRGTLSATTGTNDWKLTGTGPYTVASGASAGSPQCRTIQLPVTNAMYCTVKSWGITLTTAIGSASTTAYVWLDAYSQQVVVGFTAFSGWGIYSADGAVSRLSVTGFPSNVMKIASFTLHADGSGQVVVDSGPTDQRY